MLSPHLDIVRRDGVLSITSCRHTPVLLALLASSALVVVQTHHTPTVGVAVGVVSLAGAEETSPLSVPAERVVTTGVGAAVVVFSLSGLHSNRGNRQLVVEENLGR